MSPMLSGIIDKKLSGELAGVEFYKALEKIEAMNILATKPSQKNEPGIVSEIMKYFPMTWFKDITPILNQ